MYLLHTNGQINILSSNWTDFCDHIIKSPKEDPLPGLLGKENTQRYSKLAHHLPLDLFKTILFLFDMKILYNIKKYVLKSVSTN